MCEAPRHSSWPEIRGGRRGFSGKHSTEHLMGAAVPVAGGRGTNAKGKGVGEPRLLRLADLVELLRDGGPDDAGVEGGDVGADEWRKGARRAVGLYHVPQHRLLPLVELPVRVPPPEPARHRRHLLLFLLLHSTPSPTLARPRRRWSGAEGSRRREAS